MVQRETLGPRHPDTLDSMNSMGLLLMQRGRSEAARSMFQNAVDGRMEVVGNRHPETLISIQDLGLLLTAMGEHTAQALALT